MPRLIVISNRLPFSIKRGTDAGVYEFVPSSGGLVSALSSYIERRSAEDPEFECVWVGWLGGTVHPSDQASVRSRMMLEQRAQPVFLTESEMDSFYHGFCNSTLWPLFHYFPTYTGYSEEQWETYQHVNRIFCETALEIIKPGDVIWVHDYQLLLLPKMLRERAGDAQIGFFLHIPFPSFEIFRHLPARWRQALLEGMLGSDLVGFQIHDYTQYFLRSVFRTLGFEHHLGEITMGAEVRRAEAFPIGIDFDRFMDTAQSPEVAEQRQQLEAGLRGKKAIFSVDRLDYSKGLLHRLRGYECFLQMYPEWRARVVFILNVVPSRGEVEQYQRMKQELDELVGQINGAYGSVDWVPIIYQYRKPLARKWKEHLAPLIQLYVDRVPGSLLEEKDYSLAWHYRRADPELGEIRAKELIDELVSYTANFDVQVLEGKKVVEVRNSGVNKGAAAVGCVVSVEPDFIFAVGDDQTDEDLFRALPKTAFTVRVGIPHSHATYHLKDHLGVRQLLGELSQYSS